MGDAYLSYLLLAVPVAALSAAFVGLMRRLALRCSLLDEPNTRSSHVNPVPRLGGAAFVPMVLLALLWCWSGSALPASMRATFFGGAVLLYAISLVDDFRAISSGARLVVHCVAAAGTVLTFLREQFGSDGMLAGEPLLLGVGLVLSIVGTLNIYNFMDGIDGIAGTQAAIAGLGWLFVAHGLEAPSAGFVGALMAAGALGFLTLNWPPAKIFMGDAGSTVLGYAFAVLPLLAWTESSRAQSLLAVGVLLVWPFLADGTFTILRRLKNRENIFKAHRSHLYQRLVIAGETHVRVTLVYGLLAVLGAMAAWRLVTNAAHAAAMAIAVPLVGFVCLWLWVVRCEARNEASHGPNRPSAEEKFE